MTKVDIFSGFLGAGKTTLIKKMISQAYAGEQIVLIENEFGEIGIDGGFLQDAGVRINEMNSGCICCSLVGDFGRALMQVLSEYHPERIVIEPSGVGKLSDVIAAVQRVPSQELELDAFITVADAAKCKLYLKNFGEFYANQVENASAIVLSRTDSISESKLQEAVALLRELNPEAVIVTTPWDQLSGRQILQEVRHGLRHELSQMLADAHEENCGCHHRHSEEQAHAHHGEDAQCGYRHCEAEQHHHEQCHHHEEEQHHHHEEGQCHHHEEEQHHHHEEGQCHHHEEGQCHHHHHGHDAGEVFHSWGVETPKQFSKQALRAALCALENTEAYGFVLRAKGIVRDLDGGWLHFDYVPGEVDIRSGGAAVTGRLCVIGAKLNEQAVCALFGL